jgi:hypothetical protein
MNKPYPPRWVTIYALLIMLALIVYVVLDVLHHGPVRGHSQDP